MSKPPLSQIVGPPSPIVEGVTHVPTTTKILKTSVVQGGGKIFYIDAITNERGGALRVTEIAQSRRNSIIIPVALCVDVESKIAEALIALFPPSR